MVKKSVKKKSTDKSDSVSDFFLDFDPGTRLLSSMAGMGWRMAVMIMLPVFIGLKLDDRFDTEPSWVLVGFFIGLAGSAYLIYNEYKEINNEMQQKAVKPKKVINKVKKRDV